MPRLTHRDEIRPLLERDRPWAVYALGDLAPGLFEQCEWYAAGPEASVVLVYREFEMPVVFAMGDAAGVEQALEEVGPLGRAYLSVRSEVCALVRQRYAVEHARPMWRMLLRPERFAPPRATGIVPLRAADLEELLALHRDGEASGEAPDCFTPSMLERGVYFGLREAGELVAAAGTHLFAPEERVGAIGNVYVRSDWRGRGYGRAVTAAVAAELRRCGVETVALNVACGNTPAVRAYQALGFARYCDFYEGIAVME
jgi:ribosomal protein S18 acetylase RimI-like enzyme